jgi:predicted GTPase
MKISAENIRLRKKCDSVTKDLSGRSALSNLFQNDINTNDADVRPSFEKIDELYDLGSTSNDRDSFFDAVAQSLNNQKSPKAECNEFKHTVKSLRRLCQQYAVERSSSQFTGKENWLQNILRDKLHEYVNNIAATSEDIQSIQKESDSYTEPKLIAGKASLEGRILCEALGIKIHMVKFYLDTEQTQEPNSPRYQSYNVMIDSDGLKSDAPVCDYNESDITLIHVAQYKDRTVPILSRVNVLEQRLKEKFGVLDLSGVDDAVEDLQLKKSKQVVLSKRGDIENLARCNNKIAQLEHVIRMWEQLNELKGRRVKIDQEKAKAAPVDMIQAFHEELAKHGLKDMADLQDEIELKKREVIRLAKKNDTKKLEKRERKLAELQEIVERYAAIVAKDNSEIFGQRAIAFQDESTLSKAISLPSNGVQFGIKADLVEKTANAIVVSENMSDFSPGTLLPADLRARIAESLVHAAKIPECAEKKLIKLVCFIELLEVNISAHDDIQINKMLIDTESASLYECLKKEELDSKETRRCYEKLMGKIKIDDWLSAKNILSEMLKEIRPFDIEETLLLIKKTEEAADLIKNQNIILLLGATGAGKSTTIHFLAGSEMHETEVNGLSHIDAIKINNPALKQVKMSPSSTSVTRYITAIPVNFREVGGFNAEGSIVLCDTPGFEDTNGPEVDVANGIGLVNAVRQCRSVKPLVLISYKSIGDRLTGLKTLARTLVGIMPGIKDHMSAFTYAFTKYPSNERKRIHASLKDIVEKMSAEEKQDIAFFNLLKDMMRKTEKKINVINPLEDQPGEFLDEMAESATISHPEEVFEHFVTHRSYAIIQSQLQKHYLSVSSAAKRGDYALVNHKLDELKKLSEVISHSSIKQTYEDCVHYLAKHLNEQYTVCAERFNRCFDDSNAMTLDDIKKFQQALAIAKTADVLRNVHLGKDIVDSTTYTVNLLKMVSILAESFNAKFADFNRELALKLDKLLLLSNFFTDQKHILQSYQAICEHCTSELRLLAQKAIDSVKAQKFEVTALMLGRLLWAAENIDEHLRAISAEKYELVKLAVMDELATSKDIIEKYFLQERLGESDIESIRYRVVMLDSAVKTPKLLPYFEGNAISQIYGNVIEIIEHEFNKYEEKISEHFDPKSEGTFESLEQYLCEMDALRSIESIDLVTSKSYYRVVERLCGYVQELRRQAEQLLQMLFEQKEIDQNKLYRALTTLRNAKWIDRLRPGFYTEVVDAIDESIVSFTEKMLKQLTSIELCLQRHSKIEEAYKIYSMIQLMKPLENGIPAIEVFRQQAEKWLSQEVRGVLDSIREQFNLENRSVSALKESLEQLKRMRQHYATLHPAKLFLSRESYNSESELLEAVQLLEYKLEKHRLAMAREMERRSSVLEKLHEIRSGYDKICREVDAPSSITKLFKNISYNSSRVDPKALDYLKSHAYSTVGDLRAEISAAEKDLANIEATLCREIEITSASLTSLKAVQNRYNVLINEKSPSQEETQYLRQCGFEAIDLLNKGIDEKTFRVNELENSGIRYTFEKLNFFDLENAFCYLKNCKKFSLLNQEYAGSMLKSLQEYLQAYYSYVRAEVQKCFGEIFNNNEVFHNTHMLLNRFQELSELKEGEIKGSCPNVVEYFSAKKIIHEWRERLASQYDEFSDDMHKLHVSRQNQKLKNKIILVKSLGQLDVYLVGDNQAGQYGRYIELYRKYQDIFYDDARAVINNVMTEIHNHNYSVVAAEASRYHQADDSVSQHVFEQICRTLSLFIADYIEETQTKTIMLGSNVNVEEIRPIVENLEKIKKSLLYVGDYLDAEVRENLKNCVDGAKKHISVKIIRFLDSISASINANNFYEADVRIETISRVRHLLGVYCDNEVAIKIDELRQSVAEMLSKIVDKYTKMQLQEYSYHPPRDIYDKFTRVSNQDSKYGQAWDEIRASILNKIRDELKLAKMGKPDRKNKHLRLCESALKSLPENLQLALESELKNCQDDILQAILDHEAELVDATNSGDIVKIKSLIEEYKQSGGMDLSIKKLQEGVFKQLQESKDKVNEKLAQRDIKSVYFEIKKFYEYQKTFGSDIQFVGGLYKDVRDNVNKLFDQTIKCLINEIQSCAENAFLNVASKYFDEFLAFVEFRNDFSKCHEDFLCSVLPLDFKEKVGTVNEAIACYFQGIHNSLSNYTLEFNVGLINKFLKNIKGWDIWLNKVKRYADNHANSDLIGMEKLSMLVHKSKSYHSIIEEVVRHIKELCGEILGDLINEKTKGHDSKSRDEFYKRLNIRLSVINRIRDLREFISVEDLDISSLESLSVQHLEAQITSLLSVAAKVLDKKSLEYADYDIFNDCYANLIAFNKNIPNALGLSAAAKQACEKIESKVLQKIELIEAELENESAKVENVGLCLIEMKTISDNIPAFKDRITQRIDQRLNAFKNAAGGGVALAKLGTLLNQDKRGIGQVIISEHKCFKGYTVFLFNTKTQQHDMDYVLRKLEASGVDINAGLLKKRSDEFYSEYFALRSKYLSPTVDYEKLIAEINTYVGSLRISAGKIEWNAELRAKIPKLMAYIFVIWTLKNSHHYFDAYGVEERDKYLLQPHAAQVVSIFRMFGIGDSSELLTNNLVQIGTGEGKSVTLAVTASVLAMLGIDVSCACYSEYLSRRDYDEFKQIFEHLGVLEHIHYGTFNKLCEDVINQDGDVRKRVEGLIAGRPEAENSSVFAHRRPRVLLIDEVDVFFNKDFYGNLYSPGASLRDEAIVQLINLIWQERASRLSFHNIKARPEFIACCNKFKGWEFLIQEAVKDMLIDVANFESHDYIVHQNKIAYKEQDGLSYNVVYGYKTLFAYYNEFDKGNISRESLDANICITVNCGNFSYAEMPHRFEFIMGVSGTLKTLSAPEKDVVSDVYKIKKFTFSPSVYGQSNFQFREGTDIYIENADDYFNAIRREINNRLAGATKSTRRAVFVFFESQQKLMEFYNSKAMVSPFDNAVNILKEDVDPKDKEILIKRATTAGQVTLMTKSFGRGTDFMCRDQEVAKNGGVHVIQAFLSEELSEETQIKGRTARQGEEGSYSMVLLDRDLEKFLITQEDIVKVKESGKIYPHLNKKRNIYFKEQYVNSSKYIEDSKKEHDSSARFIDALNARDLKLVKEYLATKNKGASGSTRSRTICLMDATGSMSHLLQKSKNTVGVMFERASAVLKEHGLPADSFEMQFVVYRNYNSREDDILQASPWETKPEVLRSFMDKVSASGGCGDSINEAIEVGLFHANREAETGQVSQVILIGDAPANSQQEITQRRQSFFTEAYWKKSKFAEAAHFKTEVSKLADKGIPVHAFFVASSASTNFKEIANDTGGRCESLDINSASGADTLTNLVTEEVLRNVGGEAQGETLVATYRSKFSKSYK